MGQTVQSLALVEPAGAVLPAAQRVQFVAPALLKVLGGHKLHVAGKTLGVAMKLPAAHKIHVPVWLPDWKEPAAQVPAHAVPSARGAVPAAQAVGRLLAPGHEKPLLKMPAVALHA